MSVRRYSWCRCRSRRVQPRPKISCPLESPATISLGHGSGKQMLACGVERQRINPKHRLQFEFAVKMREQRAAAGRLPFQAPAENIAIDCDQDEIALAREPFRRGLGGLTGG